MANLNKISHRNLIKFVDKGKVSLEDYLKYKKKLQAEIDSSDEKQVILKQQIQTLEDKPTERDIDGATVWKIGGAAFLAGAGAGFLLTKDSSLLAQAITSFVCAEAGAGATILGTYAYMFKPISNAITRSKIENKYKKLTQQQGLVKKNSERLEALEREEILDDFNL